MKNIQKFIVPILIIAVVGLIYFTYFQKKGLGNFSDFDPNNNANKDIVVQVVKDKGTQEDPEHGTISFYAIDSKGVEKLVQAPLPLPGNFDDLSRIQVKGHLHADYFHATEVKQL